MNRTWVRARMVWLLLVAPGVVEAQLNPALVRPTAERGRPVQRSSPATPWDVSGPLLGATVGGVVGAFGLGMIAFNVAGGSRLCGDDPCGLGAGLSWAVAGEIIGIGLGAHVGNGGHGNGWSALGASLGALLIGSAIGTAFSDVPEVAVALIPMAQVAAAVWAEWKTDPRGGRGW